MPEPDRQDPKILEVHILTEIIGVYFIGTIVPIKYMPIISAVGLFFLDFLHFCLSVLRWGF